MGDHSRVKSPGQKHAHLRVEPGTCFYTLLKKTSREVSSQVAYAIVRAGGRQEKVSVGDLVTLDRVAGEAGSTIQLPVLMLVDGDKVTVDAKTLASAKVTAEKIEDLRGPKIVIQKYKNKTGYKKRQGHRQELTRIKITDIK